MIQFTVMGNPVAQGRPRFSTAGGFARAYDPLKSKDFKHYVRLEAKEHAPAKLLDGALSLEIIFYRPLLKSFSKKKAVEAENGLLLPTSKPDIDNYLKSVKDALSGVIWRDDSMITDVQMRKRYSSKPRIEITIKEAIGEEGSE